MSGGRRGPPGPSLPCASGSLLFSHLPYTRAEPLSMSEADVAVVVEVVCGMRAANALACMDHQVRRAATAASG